MRIRRATDEDEKAIIALWHEAKAKAYPFPPLEQRRTIEEDTRYFREHIAAHCEIWVAEREGQIVGYLAVAGTCVDRLYIRPDVQRQGVGGLLIAHAKAVSPKGLQLYTHQKNAMGRAFYEKHGFRAVKFGVSPPPESEPDVEYHWP